MNRQIKFRAWLKNSKKFIDWDKTKNPTDLLSILMRELMCDYIEKKKNEEDND